MLISNNDKDAMLQGLSDKLNVGSDTKLTIYIGADIAAVFDMPNPIEQTIANGVFSFNLPENVLATLSGVPTTAKLTNSAGSDVTFDIGTEIVLDKPSVYAGGYVSLAGLTITI